MENKTHLLVKDFDFSEEELGIISATITFFSIPFSNKNVISECSLVSVVEEMNKILQIQWIKDNANNKVYPLLTKIESLLSSYVMDKQTFEILGKGSNDSVSDDKHLVIKASSLEEAKEIRDREEAETFPTKNITIEQLLNIVNNMERSHGSATISPRLLKELIKKSNQ